MAERISAEGFGGFGADDSQAVPMEPRRGLLDEVACGDEVSWGTPGGVILQTDGLAAW